MEAWRWLGPLEDTGLSPVGRKLPWDEDFACGIGLKPQEAVDVRMWGRWGSGGGSHKQGRLPAGGGWQLEAGERTGLIRLMGNFPENKTAPQMLSSAIWTRDSVCIRPRGKQPQLVVPTSGPAS